MWWTTGQLQLPMRTLIENGDVIVVNGRHFAHVRWVKVVVGRVGTFSMKVAVVSPTEVKVMVPTKIAHKVRGASHEELEVNWLFQSIDYTRSAGGSRTSTPGGRQGVGRVSAGHTEGSLAMRDDQVQ